MSGLSGLTYPGSTLMPSGLGSAFRDGPRRHRPTFAWITSDPASAYVPNQRRDALLNANAHAASLDPAMRGASLDA
jgi:hypothetical protein